MNRALQRRIELLESRVTPPDWQPVWLLGRHRWDNLKFDCRQDRVGYKVPGVFICYRREDSGGYAGRLYDVLAGRFGKQNVFIDVDSIELGRDFVDVLKEKVASCDVLVAVIGRGWLTAADEKGCRRLDDTEDFVRLEITAALERNVPVVPVLVAGTRMPHDQDLPEVLATLCRREGLEVSDSAFHECVQKLIDLLEKRVLPLPPATPPRPQSTVLPANFATQLRSEHLKSPPGTERVAFAKSSVGVNESAGAHRVFWRRLLLLYRPGGFGSVVCRFAFYICLLYFSSSLGDMTDGNTSGSSAAGFWFFLMLTLIFWVVATKLDSRATKKPISRT